MLLDADWALFYLQDEKKPWTSLITAFDFRMKEDRQIGKVKFQDQSSITESFTSLRNRIQWLGCFYSKVYQKWMLDFRERFFILGLAQSGCNLEVRKTRLEEKNSCIQENPLLAHSWGHWSKLQSKVFISLIL